MRREVGGRVYRVAPLGYAWQATEIGPRGAGVVRQARCIDWSAQLRELFTGTNSEAARVLGVSRRAIQDTRARWRATAEEMGLV
jgi:hypothetical protein